MGNSQIAHKWAELTNFGTSIQWILLSNKKEWTAVICTGVDEFSSFCFDNMSLTLCQQHRRSFSSSATTISFPSLYLCVFFFNLEYTTSSLVSSIKVILEFPVDTSVPLQNLPWLWKSFLMCSCVILLPEYQCNFT